MKKRLTALWARRPRLSRGWKTLRNFAVFVLLCLGFWYSQECPPLTSEEALRKMERTLFLEPGQTVYCDTMIGHLRQVFVLGEGYAYTGETLRSSIYETIAYLHDEAAREQGPELMRIRNEWYIGSNELWSTTVFCPWGPEKAIRAELTLDCDYSQETYHRVHINDRSQTARGELLSLEHKHWEMKYQAQKEPEGHYVFTIDSPDVNESAVLSMIWKGYHADNENAGPDVYLTPGQAGYRLDFYDATGTLIQFVESELDHWWSQ